MESFFEAASSVAIYVALISLILNMILLVLFIVFGVKHRKLEDRIDALTRGTDGESLEAILRSVLEDNQKVKIQLKNNVDEIVRINENLLTAYRKTGLVKYNAFPGMAVKVSAVICLLNNENNGIIINTIHGQDGCYTYVKEIMNGKSINPLTKEDEEALKIALQMEI